MTGARLAFLISSTVAFASSGVLMTDTKAFMVPVAAAEEIEGVVITRGREDLHCEAKWFDLLHLVQVFPYAVHSVMRSLFLFPCLGAPHQMHFAGLSLVYSDLFLTPQRLGSSWTPMLALADSLANTELVRLARSSSVTASKPL